MDPGRCWWPVYPYPAFYMVRWKTAEQPVNSEHPRLLLAKPFLYSALAFFVPCAFCLWHAGTSRVLRLGPAVPSAEAGAWDCCLPRGAATATAGRVLLFRISAGTSARALISNKQSTALLPPRTAAPLCGHLTTLRVGASSPALVMCACASRMSSAASICASEALKASSAAASPASTKRPCLVGRTCESAHLRGNGTVS